MARIVTLIKKNSNMATVTIIKLSNFGKLVNVRLSIKCFTCIASHILSFPV